jgi:hypothetical protein
MPSSLRFARVRASRPRAQSTDPAVPAYAEAHGMHAAREDEWVSYGTEIRGLRVDLLARPIRGDEPGEYEGIWKAA